MAKTDPALFKQEIKLHISRLRKLRSILVNRAKKRGYPYNIQLELDAVKYRLDDIERLFRPLTDVLMNEKKEDKRAGQNNLGIHRL